MLFRICNPKAMNIRICNPSIQPYNASKSNVSIKAVVKSPDLNCSLSIRRKWIMLFRICNPKAMNIRICNPSSQPYNPSKSNVSIKAVVKSPDLNCSLSIRRKWIMLFRICNPKAMNIRICNPSIQPYNPSKSNVSIKAVVKSPDLNCSLSIKRKWKGMVVMLFRICNPKAMNIRICNPSIQPYNPSKSNVSIKAVVKSPDLNCSLSIRRRWNGIVVFTPSMTISLRARFILMMASSLVCADTITLAIIES